MAWLFFSQVLCLTLVGWYLNPLAQWVTEVKISTTFLLLTEESPQILPESTFLPVTLYLLLTALIQLCIFLHFHKRLLTDMTHLQRGLQVLVRQDLGIQVLSQTGVRCIFRTLFLFRTNRVKENQGHVSRPHLGSSRVKEPCIDTCYDLDLKNTYGDKGL